MGRFSGILLAELDAVLGLRTRYDICCTGLHRQGIYTGLLHHANDVAEKAAALDFSVGNMMEFSVA